VQTLSKLAPAGSAYRPVLIVLLGAAVAGGAVLGGDYFVYLLSLVGIFSLVSIGLNLLVGFSGQISLGHAGFFGIGAYASAILSLRLGLPFWLAIPAAALLTTLLGALIALPALRLRNLYLAIATLGMGIVAQRGLFEWRDITGGGAGLQVPIPALGRYSLAGGQQMMWVILAVLAAGTWTAVQVARGRTGRALTMLRESEIAAGCLGIQVARYKVIAFALSAFYTAVAGGLYANLVRYLNPESFGANMSIMFLAMTIIGGLGSIPGAILGAVFYVIVPEALRGFKDAPGLVFGLAMLLVMVLMPAGLIGPFLRRSGARK
jgi:branched-chain amino acid transport system permease protein